MTKNKTKVTVGQLPEDKKMMAVVFDYRYPKCTVRARGIDLLSGRRYTTTGLTINIVRHRLVRNSTREGRGILLSIFVKVLDCRRSAASCHLRNHRTTYFAHTGTCLRLHFWVWVQRMAKAACGAHPDGEKDAAPQESLTLFRERDHIVPGHQNYGKSS